MFIDPALARNRPETRVVALAVYTYINFIFQRSNEQLIAKIHVGRFSNLTILQVNNLGTKLNYIIIANSIKLTEMQVGMDRKIRTKSVALK